MPARALRHTPTLAVIIVAAVLAVGCAPTKASSTVHRAPWIAFKGAKTIAVEYAVSCADSTKPDGKDAVTASCAGSDVERNVGGSVYNVLLSRLRSRGYQVVNGGPADQTLRATLRLTRYREVAKWGDQKDDKDDQRCKAVCGTPTCKNFLITGNLVLRSVFVGPLVGGKYEQTVERDYDFPALHVAQNGEGADGKRYGLACSSRDADRYLNEDQFNWNKASGDLVTWMGGSFEPMFSPHTENYEVALFEVDDIPEAVRGVEQGKAGQWNDALTSFSAGLAKLTSAGTSADPEMHARLLYNLAACEMTIGKLEDAQAHVTESRRVQSCDEAEELEKEIHERLVDREKL